MGSSPAARWSLACRTALVTGATKGIGKAIAEELAQVGASVYVCARTEDELQQRLQEWKDAGLSIAGCVCDVSSYSACEQLIAQASHHFQGRLDILVLNAATVGHVGPVLEVPTADMLLTMRTNFESGVHLCRLAHPMLKASVDGSIVFNSSIAGSQIVALNFGIYASTKGKRHEILPFDLVVNTATPVAALNQLTRTLAFEWAKDGIRVNAVAPGYISTEVVAALDGEMLESVKRRVPMRRLGEMKEIAAAVAFLCMPCSTYTTGAILTIDGGMTLHNVPCSSIGAS